MTTNEHIKYWTESADYDIKASEGNFNQGYFVWSLYIGHLSLEKMLKGIYVQNTQNTTPPMIHNLTKLAKFAGLNLTEEQELIFDEVNSFQIEARYSRYKNELYKLATKSFTEKHLIKIKEQYLWLKSLIAS